MNDQYEKLKEYIKAIPENDISTKTKTDYIKTYTRLFNNDKTPFDYPRKSTHYKYRASFIYANTVLAKLKISEIEGELDEIKKKKEIEEFKSIVNLLKSYLDDDHIIYKKSVVQKSLSKKLTIAKLNKSWSTLMFEKMNDSKYLMALSVLFCTGCRSIELVSGVKVKNDNEGLTFTICGAKTHAGGKYGQEERSFTMSSDNEHYQYLKDNINGEAVIKIDSGKLLGEQIRRNSKIIMPNSKSYISPYTYRHNFSRMIKNTGLSHEDTARCLGHCNDKSQTFYSRSSCKKDNGDFKIFNITATKSIKHVVNNSYIKSSATSAPCI